MVERRADAPFHAQLAHKTSWHPPARRLALEKKKKTTSLAEHKRRMSLFFVVPEIFPRGKEKNPWF